MSDRPAWRDTENERRRERYAADPAYREKRLAEGLAAYYRNPEPKLARNRRWHADSRRDRDPEQRRRARAQRRTRKTDAFVEHVSALVVLEHDDGVCGICGGDVDPFDFHVDHIVPLAAGGLHAYHNVQAAHPACNRKKGAR